MAIHDLLVALDLSYEDEAVAHPTPAVQQGFAFAGAGDARLTVRVTGPRAEPVYSPIYASLTAGLVAEANERTEKRLAEVADAVRTAAGVKGVVADVITQMEPVDNAARAIATRARCHDLVVLDQPVAAMDRRAVVFEAVLFHGGRPVMIAPRGKAPLESVGRLMVAWDGSSHAARAAHDALAVFSGAKTVEIVSVVGEKDLTKGLAGTDMARHMSRRGVETVLTQLPAVQGSVARALEEHALKTGADLLVMGGYGHARWRELLLGGVTLDLVRGSTVPLLMAY